MEASVVSEYLAKIGRKGGKARLRTMTADERREIATRASKAAALARSKRAKAKKLKPGDIITIASINLINPPGRAKAKKAEK